jgi:hypothetical protein
MLKSKVRKRKLKGAILGDSEGGTRTRGLGLGIMCGFIKVWHRGYLMNQNKFLGIPDESAYREKLPMTKYVRMVCRRQAFWDQGTHLSCLNIGDLYTSTKPHSPVTST